MASNLSELKTVKGAMRATAVMAQISAGLALHRYFAEQDHPEFMKDIPWENRMRYWIIPTSMSTLNHRTGEKENVYIKIKKNYNPIFGLIDMVTTLGMADDEQRLESLDGMQRSNFMLHYNFPPFSVGETGRIGTGRREIGHGKLAWRAIKSSLPSKESFPYTFRIVSEITESNGSSSMATVCGTSLSLMDAGVPMKTPVAGIAMGLIKEGDDFSVLSDILGDEDHLGDMDFKVAGTKDGITSLQMDIKIIGITFEIMEKALKQAKEGRVHILGEMNKALDKSRAGVGKHTPKMEKITVDKKDIATVIGKGGATIREIVEKSGAKVDVNDEGVVTVAAPDEESRNKAMQFIKDLTAKAEMNKIYNGKVIKIMEFGAFVNFLGKQDGLVHISELADKRVAKVTDVVKEGDKVKVKVIGFDRGKVKLSIKQALA